MSRSSRSRRISRRRRRISSRSAVLGPSPRRPSSRSPCTTQLRIACAVGSNSRDNSSGLRPARTNSTIWRRNSGAYGGLDLGMVDTSSPKGQVSTNSDQLQIWRLRRDGKLPKPKKLRNRNVTLEDDVDRAMSCLLAHDSHIETAHYPLPKPLPRGFDRAPLASRALCPWWVLVSSQCSRIAAYGWAPKGGRVHGR